MTNHRDGGPPDYHDEVQPQEMEQEPEDPEAIGECEGCGKPFHHDEAIVHAEFAFNSHGGLFTMGDAPHGLYHHGCLLGELRVPDLPGVDDG